MLDMGKLVKVARRDFPNLDPQSINVEIVRNTQFSGKVGIGFDVPINEELPEGYFETIIFR
jgi:hypothetical protein